MTWRKARAHATRLLLMVMTFVIPVSAIRAQDSSRATATPRRSAKPLSAASLTQSSLDEWIVLRFRGAQLLPDSSPGGAAIVSQSGAPRIEGPRLEQTRDTLVALHFSPNRWRPSLDVGATATLADPTGVASKLQGRITARRAFRAPRRPGAVDSDSTQWRVGWAYLFAIPGRAASSVPAGFEGWLILEPPMRTKPALRPVGRNVPRTRRDSTE